MSNATYIANLLMTTPRDVQGGAYARGEIRSPIFIDNGHGEVRVASMADNKLVAGFASDDLASNKFDTHFLKTYQPDTALEAQKRFELYNGQSKAPLDLSQSAEMAKKVGVQVDGKGLSADQLIESKVRLLAAMEAATEKATGESHLLNANDFDIHTSGGLVGNIDSNSLKSLLVDNYSAKSRYVLEQGSNNAITFRPTSELVEFDRNGARLTLSLDEIVEAATEKFQRRVPSADFNRMLQEVHSARASNAWSSESLEMHAHNNIQASRDLADKSLMGERSVLAHIDESKRESLLFSHLHKADVERKIVVDVDVSRVAANTISDLGHQSPDVLDTQSLRSDYGSARRISGQSVNLTPYATPITSADVKRVASATPATGDNAIRISSDLPHHNGYTHPIPDAELKKVAASGKGPAGFIVGAAAVLAASAESAMATTGGLDKKAEVFGKTAASNLADITPVIGSAKAQAEGQPNEAIARFADWTPIGEANRYAQRASALISGKPTDVAPGMLESIGGMIKDAARKGNEVIDQLQEAAGLPTKRTTDALHAADKQMFMQAADAILSGNGSYQVPENSHVAVKATAESFADLYKFLSKDGGVSQDDMRALNLARETLSQGFDAPRYAPLQGVIEKFEAKQQNQPTVHAGVEYAM